MNKEDKMTREDKLIANFSRMCFSERRVMKLLQGDCTDYTASIVAMLLGVNFIVDPVIKEGKFYKTESEVYHAKAKVFFKRLQRLLGVKDDTRTSERT